MSSKYELLAPAGSFDALKAAVSAGCDAVYVGGNMFGARAFANNFTTEELIEAIDYCHIYGKSLYLTVNTLLKNNEIDDLLYNYLLPLYETGLDAVIVQDLGVMDYIKTNFPDLDIHASTQMTVLGKNYAKELVNLGIKRVVTPRELSLNEIKEIYESTGVQIESFVHGALCYCYSGQCLMSSLIGQRSGNRGKCAQPCRLPYSINDDKNTEYFLSPKDLCTLDILPEILEAGVYSLKIEGRMKNPEYVAIVTAIYRKYIDLYENYGKDAYHVDEADKQKLMDVFNRGGFTEGFYKKQNSDDIMYTKRPNHMGVKAGIIKSISGEMIYFDSLIDLNKNDVLEFKLKNNEFISFNLGADFKKNSKCSGFLYKKGVKSIKELANTDIFRMKNSLLIADNMPNKLKVNCDIVIKKNEKIYAKVYNDNIEIETYFDEPSLALKQALNIDTVKKQLNKTGNEAFDFENINVFLDDGLFLPMGVLNNIRRDVLDLYKKQHISSFRRQKTHDEIKNNPNIINNYIDESSFSAYICNLEQLKVVLEYEDIKNVYVEYSNNDFEELQNMAELIKKANKKPYLALPHITRDVFFKELRINLKFFENNHYEGYLFRNLETFFGFIKKNINAKEFIFDSHIYTFNNYSYDFYKKLGATKLTASYEHNINDLKIMNKELLELNVYGYIPTMISANCIKKTTGKCKRNFAYTKWNYDTLTDRVGAKQKIVYNCKYCYNIIYNDVPLWLYDDMSLLKEIGYNKFRLNFTIEDENSTKEILDAFFCKSEIKLKDYTKGHLKRGV